MNFISTDFHLHYLGSYSLIIQQDAINTNLTVLSEDNKVLVFLHYSTLNPSAESVKLLSYPFSKVLIGLHHQHLLWIPKHVFDPSEMYLYADYFLDSNIERIFQKDFTQLEAVALYQFDQIDINRWTTIFPNAQFVPLFTVFMQQSLPYLAAVEDVLSVHCFDNKVDILLSLQGEFKFYNSFEVETVEDISYYVLSLLKNFSVSSKTDKLLLSGVSEGSVWANTLARYTKELVYLKPNTIGVVGDTNTEEALVSLNLIMDIPLCV